MRTSALFALACIFAIRFSAFSEEIISSLPQITTEKIHGFDVEFVNIGKGDTLGVSFFTDYGSLDDQGRMMGRAHLLEHLFFTGNVRFPGYNTYKKMSQPAGARFNAHTGLERTYYYLSGAQEKAELLLSLELSMLGGLEWNPEYFAKERAVVINEIVQEKMTKDDSAFFMMGFLHLLPQNHPWAQHGYVGDGGNLPLMEIEDVRQLYENQYRPGRVKVVIHGNFTDLSFLNQVRQWTAKFLPSDRVQAPLALRPATPSLVSNSGEQAQQRLLVQTKNFTKGMVLIESDPQVQLPTMAVFSLLETYLSLEATGSLIHELKTVRGLVSEASFSSFRLQDKTYLMFDYTPTESGLGQESVIEGMAFEHLRGISLNGVPEETLTFIKKARLDQLKRSAASVEKFMESYEEILIDRQPMAQTVAEVQQADGQTLAQMARAFQPERALYSTLTTDSAGMETDSRFNRGYKKVNNQAHLQTLRKIMSKPVERHYVPRLVPVVLGQPNSQVENRFIHSRREPMQPLQMVLDMRNDLPDAAVAVRLKTADSTPEALVAAELMFEAFQEINAGELEYLKLRHNIELKFTREAGDLRLAAYGENSQSAPALSWAIARLGDLSLTPELFESLRMRYVQANTESYVRDFTALVTYQEVASQLDLLRPNRIRKNEIARRLSLEEAEQLWKGMRSTSNKEILMVGGFNESDADDLVQSMKKLSPLYLSAAQAQNLNPRQIEPFAKLPLVLRQDGVRSGQGVGVIRVYHGPSVLDFAESAAFETLASVVGVQVSIFNRSHQQLGYIHQAVARTFDQRNLELIIVGQTEGEENTRKTINGWQHVLELLASGQITDEDIEASRQDVLNQLTQKRNSAKEILTETYESGLTQRFDALATERLIGALQALTSADVRASASKYILGSSVAYHQLTLNPCQSLLE